MAAFRFPNRRSKGVWWMPWFYMYLALAVSSAGFPQAIRVLRYSGTVTRKMHSFRLQAYYLLGLRFPANSAKNAFCNFLLVKDRRHCPTTPHSARYFATRASRGKAAFIRLALRSSLRSNERSRVWALPVSLAATQGINDCSLFLRLLRCFSSARTPLLPMYSAKDII